MDRLVSKILAGGLSAGVFLIWWPQHITSEDLEHLVLRGLLWTLSFELLLVAFGPAEDLVRKRIRARLAARRKRIAAARLLAMPSNARAGGALALACCALAAPLALFAGAPHELQPKAEPKPKVVRIVERPVIERKVVVRKVVGPAAAEAAAARATTDPLQSAGAAPSVQPTTPARSTTKRRAATTKPANKPGPTKKSEPRTTTTTPAETTPADAPAAETSAQSTPSGDAAASPAP